MMHQPLSDEEVLLVDFCDETCPDYEHAHEICEDDGCPYQRPSNGMDYTHLHEAHPLGQPPRNKIKNNLNNHSFRQHPLDMRSINQHNHRSWSATARSPPSYDHHSQRSKAYHGYDRHHRSSIGNHSDRSAMASSYSFDGLSQHSHAHSEVEYSSCSTPHYDIHYDVGPAAIPLGPPQHYGNSMCSPPLKSAYHRTPDSQRSPIQRSPVLSMRSSVSSRSSDISLSTLGSQSPAISGKSSSNSLQMTSIMYSQPVEPPHPVRSSSQPTVPALLLSDNHYSGYHHTPNVDYTPTPAILPPTNYPSRPKPLIVHTGLTSPMLLPIQAVPAVEISSSPLSTATPSSASVRKRRRDTAVTARPASPSFIARGSVTDTHFYSGNKHFMFGSPVLTSGPSSAYVHAQRRNSSVNTASYTGDDSPGVPVLLLPRSAMPMQRDASVPVAVRRTSVSHPTHPRPPDVPSKRRKSVIEPPLVVRSPTMTSPIDASLLQLVKLQDPYRAMVVACVQYLHSSIARSSEPLHVKARNFLHSRFSEAPSSPWTEPVITHALWVHERGWSDYSLNCPRDIHVPSVVHLPPSPSVQHVDHVIPRFSTLVLDQQ